MVSFQTLFLNDESCICDTNSLSKSPRIVNFARLRRFTMHSALDWTLLPDLGAVVLLTVAFGSVARRGQTSVSRLWLIAWVMIGLHFAALIFAPVPGLFGTIASLIGWNSLAWAGVLFMWACVAYRNRPSSRWMLAVLLVTNTLYITLINTVPQARGPLVIAALLYGLGPLTITLLSLRSGFSHTLRWSSVILYGGLSIFLLLFQMRVPNGQDLAFNAVIFTVYMGCCVHFWIAYRRATAGAFVALAGFLAWSAVFVVAPFLAAYFPTLHVQSEVWNLPKYVVAVGMILLLLEDQIEHNKYLALHDDLTGLPNRRLFQDRLAGALERARRSGARAALLLIDLDQFKQVNDTVGHHVGDLLLQRVGQLFLGRVRRSDTVARTGGDEFSVILEDPVTREDAARVGQMLASLLQQPQDLGGHIVSIGASVGVGLYPEDAADAESLCIAADTNMYADKTGPRKSSTRNSGIRLPQPTARQN
jgi:diguanylate cyclase (GGDEF)-like protein